MIVSSSATRIRISRSLRGDGCNEGASVRDVGREPELEEQRCRAGQDTAETLGASATPRAGWCSPGHGSRARWRRSARRSSRRRFRRFDRRLPRPVVALAIGVAVIVIGGGAAASSRCSGAHRHHRAAVAGTDRRAGRGAEPGRTGLPGGRPSDRLGHPVSERRRELARSRRLPLGRALRRGQLGRAPRLVRHERVPAPGCATGITRSVRATTPRRRPTAATIAQAPSWKAVTDEIRIRIPMRPTIPVPMRPECSSGPKPGTLFGWLLPYRARRARRRPRPRRAAAPRADTATAIARSTTRP